MTKLISVNQKVGNHSYGHSIPDKTNGEIPALSKKNARIDETRTIIVLREMDINHKIFFILFWCMVKFASPGDSRWTSFAFFK
jgi:hypothetical protein